MTYHLVWHLKWDYSQMTAYCIVRSNPSMQYTYNMIYSHSKSLWGTESKALLKSSITRSVCNSKSNVFIMSCMLITSWLSHECPDLKSCCKEVKMLYRYYMYTCFKHKFRKVWRYQMGNQKDRWYNDPKKKDKRTNNDLQNTTQKTKYCENL
jgi:hypothetical protein